MKSIETANAPAALGPYTQGMESRSGLIFTSGQIGLVPGTGEPAGDTIEAQAEQAIRNVGAILEAAGAGYGDVLKTVCFLADMDDFAAFNAVYAKFFTGDIVLIDCDKVEEVIAENLYERSMLDYLIYNDPASYTELILEGHPEKFLKAVTQYTPLDS